MSFKIKIFCILLLFIQSRVVHGINIHYCGNLVADLSYLHNAEGCDMHNSKSEKIVIFHKKLVVLIRYLFTIKIKSKTNPYHCLFSTL